MDSRSLILSVSVLCAATVRAAPKAACPLVPRPKVYSATDQTARLAGSQRTVIVVGDRATAPERYAAQLLRQLVARRFGIELAVATESRLPKGAVQKILLGQVGTNSMLADACRNSNTDLSAERPGHDGFVLRVIGKGNTPDVLTGGSNPRGVIYGAQAFFELLEQEGKEVTFPVASIQDWPSIPWRGRPQSVARLHLEPGTFDTYVRARMNFLDLRFAAKGVAPFGVPPGFAFDKQMAADILEEAHKRGMFVYGTVSCGVKPDRFDAAIKTFEELVALGVDGLWISFDDPGPGRDAGVLMKRALEVGKRHGMTGRRIAITPPTGSYQHIDTEFNRAAVEVPGMADITWFFTRVPCRRDLAATKKLGLTRLPAWWHNWPRTSGGFTHDSYGGRSLRADDKPAYLDLPRIRLGWHGPRYEKLTDAKANTDTVMFWGRCWPEHYTACVLGIWAWDPATHDWELTRRAIYSAVFGRSLAGAAAEFDDALAELKSLFHLPVRQTKPKRGWPCRLKNPEDRPGAEQLLAKLSTLLARLEQGAPGATLLSETRLRTRFLEPMRATVTLAGKMTALDYPEYGLPDFDNLMYGLWGSGRAAALGQALAEYREQVLPKLTQIESALAELKNVSDYTRQWRERLSGLEYWERAYHKRRETMAVLFKQLVVGPYAEELGNLGTPAETPPALGELTVEQFAAAPCAWKGKWAIGTYREDGRSVLAIAFPGKTGSEPGQYAQVTFTVPVPKFQGKLLLGAYIADTHVTDRWTRYRYMQLLCGDELLWEEDIALPTKGREWREIDLTKVARNSPTVPLTFRVIDKRAVANYCTVTFLGGLRLFERKP